MRKLGLVLLTIVCLWSCEKEETTYVLDKDNLAGVLQSDVTLQSNETYYLDGAFVVEKGGVLRIEPGVTIIAKGGTSSYIAVARGARIEARGTSANPIVFTSDVKQAGSWGGLVVCGMAPSNLMSNDAQPVQAEVTDMLYGGSDVDDDSGELSYIRVEYSGYSYDDDKQFNGFSFFGVGSQTIINNISSYESMDDGIEFFGGNVSADYIAAINSHDDGIDFTDGWQGRGTYWYSYNSEKSGIEGSNNDTNSSATPCTSTQLSHLTVYKMGERPWYLKKGSGNQMVDDVVIGGMPDQSNYAYFYYEENDKTTIDNILSGSVNFSNTRFINRGEGNDTDASGNLVLDINASAMGAGAWTDEMTLAPAWLGSWATPQE